MDSRSLLPLVRGEHPEWPAELLAEFHGHHFPYPQRMIRDDRYKLIASPEPIDEPYDLEADPHELSNRYTHPEPAPVRRRLMRRPYDLPRERGDNLYHWMTPMYDIGALDDDPTLGSFEKEGSTA